MERILTPEEKIKRAQEIYARRNNKTYATVNVSEQKDVKLLKKVFIQMFICLLLYFAFYLVQNTNYFFSEDVISNTKNLLSYDIDLKGIYQNISVSMFQNKNQEEEQKQEEQAEQVQETTEEQGDTKNNTDEEAKETIEDTLSATDTNEEYEEAVSSLDQMQVDANDIKNNYSIIKPIEGIVSSEFGTRDVNNPLITPYHAGIDLAANEGTQIHAAMGGTVVISKYSNSYR